MRFGLQFCRWAAMVAGSMLSSAALPAEVGDEAPAFSLAGSDGNMHSLADYRGRHVVLAFFPKAFTGG